jgi:DNA-damage-inducible protein J
LILHEFELQCHSNCRRTIMSANALVQTRISSAIRDEAAAALAAMGLTVSDAVRMMLTKVAHDHVLPFDPLVPNAKTVAAMREARAGNLPSFNSVADLMADLNAPD